MTDYYTVNQQLHRSNMAKILVRAKPTSAIKQVLHINIREITY